MSQLGQKTLQSELNPPIYQTIYEDVEMELNGNGNGAQYYTT